MLLNITYVVTWLPCFGRLQGGSQKTLQAHSKNSFGCSLTQNTYGSPLSKTIFGHSVARGYFLPRSLVFTFQTENIQACLVKCFMLGGGFDMSRWI